MIREQARRIRNKCLEEQEPFCVSACPFHLDVREFVRRVGGLNFTAAYRLYAEAVVFPALISACCDEACRGVCPRRGLDDAVSLRAMERAVLAYAADRTPPVFSHAPRRERVAVVGGGPGGLACALHLARRKYRVAVYERAGRLGGSFLDILPAPLVAEEIDRQFANEEVVFVMNREIGDLAAIKPEYDAIYVATGRGGDDFGLLAGGVDGCPYATPRWGVFLGGSLMGASVPDAAAQGLKAAERIEAFLATGEMRSAIPYTPTRMWLDSAALVHMEPVVPADGERYTPEEAALEAHRCIGCRCDACYRNCSLMYYFDKFPRQIEAEVGDKVRREDNGETRSLPRFVSSCNQCGLCAEVCPEDIDVGQYLREAHATLRSDGRMPWAFHEFWLRDMEFSCSEEASLLLSPRDGMYCEYVFFPGCQLGASDPEYVVEMYGLLRDRAPATALAIFCCGRPADWSGDVGLMAEYCDKVRSYWRRVGKAKGVFACPSCLRFVEEHLPEIEAVSLYELLDQWGVPPRICGEGKTVSVFDPCSARYRRETQDAVRRLLERAGYVLKPLERERERTPCCSAGGQIGIADPEYTDWTLNVRVRDGEHPYATYCVNCRDTFAGAGKETLHIMDVYLGSSGDETAPLTWSARRRNRIRLKQRILERYPGDHPLGAPDSRISGNADMPSLTVPETLAWKLHRRYLIEEEVHSMIEECRARQWGFTDRSNGRRYACGKIGRLSLWAEYLPTEKGYELLDAYSHRAAIAPQENLAARLLEGIAWRGEVYCDACGVRLSPLRTRFSYLGNVFQMEVPGCSSCGRVLIPSDLAMGALAQLERGFEDR